MADGVDPEQIRASVEEATPGGYGVQFGGYLLMYRALAGRGRRGGGLAGGDDPAGRRDRRRHLPRSATLAFIAAAQQRTTS